MTTTRARRNSEAEETQAQDAPLEVQGMDAEGLELDFSVVKELEPVEADRQYYCLVTGMKFGKAQRSGFGKVDIEYTVQEPLFYSDRKMVRTYSLQPQSLFGLFNVLVALGDDPESLKDPNNRKKVIPENYLGLPIVVVSQNEEYEGQMRSRPRRVLPAVKWEPWEPGIESEEDGDESVADPQETPAGF